MQTNTNLKNLIKRNAKLNNKLRLNFQTKQ